MLESKNFLLSTQRYIFCLRNKSLLHSFCCLVQIDDNILFAKIQLITFVYKVIMQEHYTKNTHHSLDCSRLDIADNCDSAQWFASKLLQWYSLHKRNLPWRETDNPYLIWLSEVILQQTRVAQGESYYHAFIQNFPTVVHLAQAPLQDVLKCWEGLGYYSRARNLHKASQIIAEKYNGVFPSTYEEILSLPGIGEYTATAIMSFAYKQPYAVVDGNVYRVLARVFGIDDYIDSSSGKKRFGQLAQMLIDKENPSDYNQAIMDFGALQCTPRQASCSTCVMHDSCAAQASGMVEKLPKKRAKKQPQPRFFHYLEVVLPTGFLVHQRSKNDIWKNLYELPLIETVGDINSWIELTKTEAFASILGNNKIEMVDCFPKVYKHVLSHQVIYARFYRVYINRFTSTNSGYQEANQEEVSKLPFPRLINRYFEDRAMELLPLL